ncbi:MAG TPA: ROK family protein [Thermoplasmata archaeon]|nr:ROK family protein [Thermoplasmata archaeon]
MADGMGSTIGVDLGATKVATVLLGDGGRILATDRRPTGAERGISPVISTVLDSVRAVTRQSSEPVRAAGVGVAAQVDLNGSIRFAPNLRWRNVALGDELSRELRLPVTLLNDVRAATLAEWKHGAGQGERDLVCLFLGTGLGGGVVSGGRLLIGDANAAGELGHLTVQKGGRRCTCPNSGCLEAYVSGWALAERARETASADPASAASLQRRAGGSLERVDAGMVIELARSGDAFSSHLLEETRDYLAAGLVGIANAFNPRLILGGGGLLEGTPELFDGAFEAARPSMLPSVADHVRCAHAALGGNAVALGAAAWARGEGQ